LDSSSLATRSANASPVSRALKKCATWRSGHEYVTNGSSDGPAGRFRFGKAGCMSLVPMRKRGFQAVVWDGVSVELSAA
jgi:hypothetical protein